MLCMVVVLVDGKWEFYDNKPYGMYEAINVADSLYYDRNNPQEAKIVQFMS